MSPIILVSALLTTISLTSTDHALISSSYQAPFQTHKFVVRIIAYKNETIARVCTGIVLSTLKVLTIADCVSDYKKNPETVKVEYGKLGNITKYAVTKMFFHQNLKREFAIIWKICLLKISPPFAETVPLNFSQTLLDVTHPVAVEFVGYGKTYDTQSYSTMTTLLSLSFLASVENCPCLGLNVPKNVFCTKRLLFKDRCCNEFGDVGGPMIHSKSIEAIFYGFYDDILCEPIRLLPQFPPCYSEGYAIFIPLCFHSAWLMARVPKSHIQFHSNCDDLLSHSNIIESSYLFYLMSCIILVLNILL